MTTVTASLTEAYSRSLSARFTEGMLHPVYGRLLHDLLQEDGAGRDVPEQASPPGEPRSDVAAEDALLVRHLCAPALLTLAVEGDGPLRRLRIGIHADGVSIESSTGSDGVSLWEDIARGELLERIRETLPPDGPLPAPPRLTVEHGQSAAGTDSGSEHVGEVLTLSPDQMAEAERHLRSGKDPRTAFSDLTSESPLLRDALTAEGARASLSVVLQDPRGTLEPASLMRLWSTGELGVYRTDTPDSPVLEVIPVAPGDLLATALGLLEESFRFIAARSAGGTA